MKHLKHIKKVFASICVLLLAFIVSISVIAGILADEQKKLLLASKKKNETVASNGNLENLPPFITEEMMKALFETQEQYGIPVSTGLGQIIAEGGFGKYGPNGESGQGLSSLSYNYKNLFGIKFYGKDLDKYAIAVKNFATGEQTPTGGDYTVISGFSVYASYTDCIKQRAAMLQKEPYYSRTIKKYKNNNDGKYTKAQADGFIGGIKDAGWATSVTYKENCLKHMQTYNLYVYDNLDWTSYQNTLNGGGGGDSVIIGNGYFCHPCPGYSYISSYFGYRQQPIAGASTNHKGVDFAAAIGTPIYAPADGTVQSAAYSGNAGNLIIISHGSGMQTYYMHCSKMIVKSGQTVKKGQQIGMVGNTGNSTGPHLHFQVMLNGTPVDPMKYL